MKFIKRIALVLVFTMIVNMLTSATASAKGTFNDYYYGSYTSSSVDSLGNHWEVKQHYGVIMQYASPYGYIDLYAKRLSVQTDKSTIININNLYVAIIPDNATTVNAEDLIEVKSEKLTEDQLRQIFINYDDLEEDNNLPSERFRIYYGLMGIKKKTTIGVVVNYDGSDGEIPVNATYVITPAKKAKINLDLSKTGDYDYRTYTNTAEDLLHSFVSSIELTDVSNKTVKYISEDGRNSSSFGTFVPEGSTSSSNKLAVKAVLNQDFKENNNGIFEADNYKAFMQQGGEFTLYLGNAEDEAFDRYYTLYGYELSRGNEITMATQAKLKIKAPAKAPKIKSDYVKGTVAITNGMEFSYDKETWYKIPVYDKNSSNTETVTTGAIKTSTKLSALNVNEIVSRAAVTTDSSVTVYVRKSATNKTLPSRIRRIKIEKPATLTASTNAAITAVDDKKKTSTVTLPEILGSSSLEYMLIKNSDIGNVELLKSKWTKVSGNTISFKNTKSSTYKLSDGKTSVSTDISEECSLLVRAAGNKTSETFTGAPIIINISKNLSE